MEAVFLHLLGYPASLQVVFTQVIPDTLHGNEPRGVCLVDQRGLTALAERLTMCDRGRCDQIPFFFECFDDVRVCIFDLLPLEVGDFVGEAAVFVERTGNVHVSAE